MRSSIAVLAASVMGTVAQSTSIVSLFLGSPDAGQEWVGSVVTAGPSDTVYEILCTASMCGTNSATVSPSHSLHSRKPLLTPDNQQTLTVGPSHLNYQYVTETMGVEASASNTCQISGTTSAVCHVTFNLDVEVAGVTTVNTQIVTTTSFSGSVLASVPVTLTGGVEKLAAATAASGSGSSSAGSGSSSRASSSAGAASSSVAGAASAASTSGTSVSIVSF
jgi:hypothetical protein